MRLNWKLITLVAAACLLTAALALIPLMAASVVHANLSAPLLAAIVGIGAASVVTGIASRYHSHPFAQLGMDALPRPVAAPHAVVMVHS